MPLGRPSLGASLLAAALLAGGPGVASAAEAQGWRNDGTGFAAGAHPPIPGAVGTAVRWKTPTESWGNASPVQFQALICITEEPTTLACFDEDSGERRWSAGNLYIDTLEGEARHTMAALLEGLDQQALRLDVLRVEMTRVQRQLRQAQPSDGVEQRAAELLREMNTIKTELDEHEDYRLAEGKGIIGYGTPTPVVSGDAIYALFGNGVLSSFSPSGERRWSVWLGRQSEPMIGYDTGTAASPVMADGVLVVPFGRIRGIDPATGRVLWRGSEYRHFGSPAIARVDGEAVVATPSGDLLRPANGARLGSGLGEVRYVGPVAVGDMVYRVGAYQRNGEEQGARGMAHRLHRAADGHIEASKLWERQLSGERSYTTPLVVDGRIWVVYTDGQLDVLSASTGEQLSRTATGLHTWSGSPSPTLGDDRVILGSEIGSLQAFTHAAEPEQLGELRLEAQLATPLLDGGRIYVRTQDHLLCIE